MSERCRNFVWTEVGFYRCGLLVKHHERCHPRIEEQAHDRETAAALMQRLQGVSR